MDMNQAMRRALTIAAILAATPVLGDDPPATEQATGTAKAAEESSAPAPASKPAPGAEEVRTGAPGMEPQETESQEDRREREFVEEIWNSP
jgi:hypothetical protein